MKKIIVNVNLEIPVDSNKSDEEAIAIAEEYELPEEYVEDSFEVVKVIDDGIIGYRVIDRQFDDKRYFAGGTIFETLEEICERLILYHEIDSLMSEETELFNEGRIKECWESLRDFEWDLEPVYREDITFSKLHSLLSKKGGDQDEDE